MSVAANVERRVEPEPPEQEDEAAEGGHGNVVAENGPRLAVLTELAEPGPEHHGPGESGHATGCVNHARAGEVDVAVAQIQAVSELR